MFTPEDAIESWLRDFEEGAHPTKNIEALKTAWKLYTDSATDEETREKLKFALDFMIDGL